jgi:predicted transcriptional regulator
MFPDRLLGREKLREIEKRLQALDAEHTQIEEMLRSATKPQKARITIMEATLEVLNHKPLGMTAKEILAELNANYFGGKLVRASLSPQLSRLKDRDKKIELQGDRWIRLPDQPSLFRDGR